jgi:hypothetical protein
VDELIAQNLAEEKAVVVDGLYAQSFLVQLKELWGRCSIMYWRNPSYNLVSPPPLRQPSARSRWPATHPTAR